MVKTNMPLALPLFFTAAIGALCGVFYGIPHVLYIALIAIGTFLALFSRRGIIFLLLTSISLFSLAGYLANYQNRLYTASASDIVTGRQTIFHGRLDSLSRDLDGDQSGILALHYLVIDGESRSATQRLQVSFKNGAAALPLQEGQTIRILGTAKALLPAFYPGSFNAQLFGFARNIHGSLSVKDSMHAIIWHVQPESPVFSRVRNNIRDRLTELVTPREASVILAGLIGDTRLFDRQQTTLYRQIGAGHLLAVSGLQISMFAIVFFGIFRVLFLLCPYIGPRGYAQRCAAILSIMCVALFVCLCGASPSATRAGLMASTMLSGMILGRNISTANALGLAGLFSVLYWPSSVVDPSFLLSYAAILGLVTLNSRARNSDDRLMSENTEQFDTKSRRKKYVLSLATASICASFMTIPLSAFLFGELAGAGIVANMVIVPIASFLQVPALFFATIAVFGAWPWAAKISAWLLGMIEALCEGMSRILVGIVPIDSPSGFIVFLLTIIILMGILFLSQRRYLLVTTCAMCALLMVFVPNAFSPAGVKISILPVGQGDSSVFQLPSGHTIIIDAGGTMGKSINPGESVVVPFLQRQGIQQLDVMVVSHPDPDHILGLFPVLNAFKVRELWISGYEHTHPLMKRLVHEARLHGTKIRKASELIGIHQFGETRVEVLGPHPKNYEEIYSELSPNDNSLVLKFFYGSNSALWPGDIEEWGERYLLEDYPTLRTDIVKAPHHGSKTSSSPEFVKATSPAHIVFCTGPNNRWGFPHTPVLNRWQKAGATVWNTGANGLITVWLTGANLVVKPFRL